LKKSLKPIERYSLAFKEVIDPFYSIHAVNEWQRQQAKNDDEGDLDVDKIEEEKQKEEERALADGDLLATFFPTTGILKQRHLYLREKRRVRAEVKRKRLTGESWMVKTDGKTQFPFYFNNETGEARWEKPRVLVDLDEYSKALKVGWEGVTRNVLVHILKFLKPIVRMRCGEVSKKWRNASIDVGFMLRVLPAEGGSFKTGNVFKSLNLALDKAQAGDVIELGQGHHWESGDIVVKAGVMIEGDEVRDMRGRNGATTEYYYSTIN